jgi:DNA modification methylase
MDWRVEMNVLNQYLDERMALYNGDTCEVITSIPSSSLHFSIFSPPFINLYTYSDSERDLGNCKSKAEFFEQFAFIVRELYRCLIPGRLMAVHCMNYPLMKERDGVIGLSDFRGDLIRLFLECGFVYHSEVCIWKDPVIAMQRTKALGLLYKQLKKDSAMSRQGIPDYLIVMRKPGENPERITHTPEDFPCDMWQKYASPVWFDINPSDTLNTAVAKDEKDEKHICPLQIQVIERSIALWTNPGETVFSPFGGIGSEPYTALKMGRKAIAVELKPSWFDIMVKNCKNTVSDNQVTMFDLEEINEETQEVENEHTDSNGV